VAIIEHLPMELVSVLIRNISADLQNDILKSISREKSNYLNKTLTYQEGTVGSIMEPLVYTFFEDMVVSDVIGTLKNQSKKNEIYFYIVTRDHKLAGVITVSELLRAKSHRSLGTIMNPKVTKIYADTKLNLISDHHGWQEYPVLPVVDNKDILQGVLKYKIIRQLEEGHIKNRVPQHLVKASSALGELYRIGMTSLIQGASTLYNQPEK
jgi:magnesium transporter